MTNSMKSLLMLTFVFLPAAALPRSILGGITKTTVLPSDRRVVFAVGTINAQLTKNNSITNPLSLEEVVHAETQIVAGELLYLTLRLSEGYTCTVVVWDSPWLNDGNGLKVNKGPSCTTSQQAPSHVTIFGGISQPLPVSGGDGEVLEALRYAACAANTADKELISSAYKLGDINSGVTYTQQVTQGLTYRFYNVPLLPTACGNNGCAQLGTCDDFKYSPAKRCDFEVWYQAWEINPYALTNMSCKTDSDTY